jgi:30S ribosomal protein 3
VTHQLKLTVLWSKNSLGLAIDQTVLKQSYFLTQYYFWPKTEAWEQLKLELASKSWIPESEKIKILNLVAEIMNYWRESRNRESLETLIKTFSNVNFVELHT